jgi:hypothetical protein
LISARDKVIRDYEVDCKVYYIIEGPSAFPRDKVAGIAANCFTGFFNKVIINDNCHVLYTDSHEGTAARILSLVKSYDKLRDAGLLRNFGPKEKPRAAATSSAAGRAPVKKTQSRAPRVRPVAIATPPSITSASAVQAMMSTNNDYDSDFSYDIDGGDDSDAMVSLQPTFTQPPKKLPTKPVVKTSPARKPRDVDIDDNDDNGGGDSSESEDSNTTAVTNLTSVTNITVATNKTNTTNALTERPNELSLEAKRDKCLLAMKSGITEKNIDAIREFGIKKIILGKVTKAALEKKTVGGKKISAGIINKILEIPKDHDTHVKLLNGITGVSKELAENILTSYSIADLYKIDSSALAAFKRNYGQFKPIGAKLAAEIARIIDC